MKHHLFLYVLFFFVFSTNSAELGVGIHSKNFEGDVTGFSNLLNEYDINSVRTDLYWDRVELTKGKYNFPDSTYAEFINKMVDEKKELILVLGYGNKIYESFNSGNPRGKPTSDTSIQAFSNYASWVASNVKSDSVIFEVWNEWVQMAGEGNRNNALSDDSAIIYSKLVNASCYAIKKENPQSKVIIGGISTFDSGSIRWIENVIKNGGMDCADGISIHPYDFSKNKELSAEHTMNSITSFHEVLQQEFNKDYAFYITEIGVPDGGKYNRTEGDVANYLNGFLQLALPYNYIKGVWWYDFINDGDDSSNTENNFGLLRHDKTPKMSADIFKTFSSSLKSK